MKCMLFVLFLSASSALGKEATTTRSAQIPSETVTVETSVSNKTEERIRKTLTYLRDPEALRDPEVAETLALLGQTEVLKDFGQASPFVHRIVVTWLNGASNSANLSANSRNQAASLIKLWERRIQVALPAEL